MHTLQFGTFIVFSLSTLMSTLSNAQIVYTNSTSLDEDKYQVQWTFDNSTDTFYFKIEVEAKGWISFGFTELASSSSWMRNAMHSYDVLVGGVYSNGTVYGLDYLTAYQNKTQYPDHVDTVNDWNITSAEEIRNKTIMEFNRKRVTSEPMDIHDVIRKGDISITPGIRYFAWAYHKTIDTPYLDNIALIHDKSGLHKVMLLPVKDDTKDPIHITYIPPTERGDASQLTLSLLVNIALPMIALLFMAQL